MAQIFHPSMNTISRVSIFGGLFILAGIVGLMMIWVRSDYATGVNVVREQPIPFSHQHHVNDIGIDCRYCHTSVEKSGFAGMPATKTCMNCHSHLLSDTRMIQPIHESWRSGKPIRWTRVHDLPDFAYFDHSIHVAKGIGCTSCHGEVDEMPLMWRAETLHMQWCLDCHRDPEKHIRPREDVFRVDYQAENQEELGPRLIDEYNVHRKTDCYYCHR